MCSLKSENSETRRGENWGEKHQCELFTGGIRPDVRLHLSINPVETEKQLNCGLINMEDHLLGNGKRSKDAINEINNASVLLSYVALVFPQSYRPGDCHWKQQ